MAHRKSLAINGIHLSYLEFGGSGTPLLALHGHFGCARMFAGLADSLHQEWRIIALDQRGHGWSDKPTDYSRGAYIKDLRKVIETLELAPVVLLGHSLGGLNAYQLAAQRPDLVRAMIVEDMGAKTNEIPIFMPDWPVRFDTINQVLDFLKSKELDKDTYFLESLIEHSDGWGFQFQYDQMINSQQLVHGDWSQDWSASTCPALLLHGHKSWVLTTEHAREMANCRPNTWLVEFPDAGHTIHDEQPKEFYATVKNFLDKL